MPTFAPGYRIAYERDGSAVYRYNPDGSPNHPASSSWSNINDEDNDTLEVGQHGASLAVVMAVPRHIVGYYHALSASLSSGPTRIQHSSDTTDGLDGTWTTIESLTVTSRDVLPTYRTSIVAVNLSGVKGFRVRSENTNTSGLYSVHVRALHLYMSTQDTFLKVWDPITDTEIPYGNLDWEIVYAGEVYKKQFRIKNIRSMQANNVSVHVTTYTDQTPSINSAYSFSLDDVTYSRPLNIGNIAAGAISPLIYVKLALPSTQTVTTYATQIHGIPGSWT